MVTNSRIMIYNCSLDLGLKASQGTPPGALAGIVASVRGRKASLALPRCRVNACAARTQPLAIGVSPAGGCEEAPTARGFQGLVGEACGDVTTIYATHILFPCYA
jgi:hypothetical protein